MTCDEHHCVTCADEALPMRVLAVRSDTLAFCAGDGGEEAEVMTELVGPVAVGQTLLVHAGTALGRVT